jgi:hypothetical protein
MKLINSLWLWAIVNIFVGIWEVYVYSNRNQLKLEKITLWEKMAKSQINIRNFWMEGWSEYCKVDARYIFKQYVWGFELLNAIIAALFIIALCCKSFCTLKILLGVSIVNCLLYFITLIWEMYFRDSIIKENIIKENIEKYSKKWMLIVYYLISGIWLIVPLWLYMHLSIKG